VLESQAETIILDEIVSNNSIIIQVLVDIKKALKGCPKGGANVGLQSEVSHCLDKQSSRHVLNLWSS
jgi:hypothetical protein